MTAPQAMPSWSGHPASAREARPPSAGALVVGAGRHTYEVVPHWAQLPDGVRFGYTHGVATDSQNRLIVFNQSKDAVMLFDDTGKFIKSWNRNFERGAHGLTLNREAEGEFLYLTDYELGQVCKSTLDGEILWTLSVPPLGDIDQNAPYKPTNTAVAPNGDIYVADGYGQNYIHRYNAKAEYLGSFGGSGKGLGQLACPHSLCVDTRGPSPVLLVADRANVRLQTFTLEGKPLQVYANDLRHPCHFDIRGTDLLIPDLHGRVTIFDRHNQLITHLGDNPGVQDRPGYPNLPAEQREPGKFIAPHAACWDKKGDMYVVEWIAEGRLTKLRHVA